MRQLIEDEKMFLRYLDCWSSIQNSGALLTILISGRNGRYRNIFDRSVRLLDPGRCGDFSVAFRIGSRMDQGLERSSDTIGDEATTAEDVNASIYNDLSHLSDFIPWHEYELVTLRMAVQVDCDHTARLVFSIRVTDRNLDVVVGCSMCTVSEDARKGAAG